MLRSLEHLFGYTILAQDGDVGSVRDALFDDQSWEVRYLMIDTGKWLPGRKVVIPPQELGEPNWEEQRIPTSMTREQVKRSPPIDAHQPVSAQHEQEVHRYFGWQPYWGTQAMPLGQRAIVPAPIWVRNPAHAGVDPRTGGKRPNVAASAVGTREAAAARASESGSEPGLRSVHEVDGYGIQALDDDLGSVKDVIVDTDTWGVAYFVIDTRRWLPGRRVLISPDWVDHISWADQKLHVRLTKDQVKNSPEYDPSQPINQSYRERLHDYYGRPIGDTTR